MNYYYNLGLLFHDVAKAHKANTALNYPEQQINFAQLMEYSEQLAAFLLSKKLKRGDLIAIGNTKGHLSYALMIACIRLGIAYVNLDVAAPLTRNLKILEVSKPKFLFYDDPDHGVDMMELSAAGSCDALALGPEMLLPLSDQDRHYQSRLTSEVDGSTIAYVMFTSGSTGIPKGVAVTHQNVLHFIFWGRESFQIDSNDNFAHLSPMYFDNSVFDFYVGLFSGASLTPVSRDLLAKPYDLVNYITQMRCSIWFSVPSLLIYLMAMKAITNSAMHDLRYIIFGGEGYPKPELKKLYDRYAGQASLVNVYGPTECTCICSAYFLTDSDFHDLTGLPPLGRLNNNFDYQILDDEGNESKRGELCLIGPNVAAGYFNDFERSAKSFITLFQPNRFMKPMYKTGDIVEEYEGILYFLGRKDNQIKHMGYRIELEEIEQALVKLPQVNQAAVIYSRTTTAYGKIIGFIATNEAVDERDLLNKLADYLPEYMIPQRLMVKDILPKNANGKVDRRQLMVQEGL